MHKKNLIYIVGILVLFTVGFFSGRISATGTIKELGNRSIDIKRQLDAEVTRSAERTESLRIAESEITKLTEEGQRNIERIRQLGIELGKFTEENNKLIGILRDIGKGYEEDSGRLLGVIDGLRYYIEKVPAK